MYVQNSMEGTTIAASYTIAIGCQIEYINITDEIQNHKMENMSGIRWTNM